MSETQTTLLGLVDRYNGHVKIVGFYDSQEALDTAKSALEPARERYWEAYQETPALEAYEVAYEISEPQIAVVFVYCPTSEKRRACRKTPHRTNWWYRTRLKRPENVLSAKNEASKGSRGGFFTARRLFGSS